MLYCEDIDILINGLTFLSVLYSMFCIYHSILQKISKNFLNPPPKKNCWFQQILGIMNLYVPNNSPHPLTFSNPFSLG